MRPTIFVISIVLTFCLKAQPFPHVIVLGTAQDGGFPHIGCQNECQLAHKDPSLQRYVVSLALVDPETKKWWLFEATPDMDKQLQLFRDLTEENFNYLPDGIFLSHAHMGHYTGLMFLGKEALGSKKVRVYAAPKMTRFLKENGPWSQLVKQENIEIEEINESRNILLGASSSVRTFTVPHRDEFSETIGFNISTTDKSYLFIPDIDKWERWEKDIVEEVKSVHYAFLDATFYENGELPNRSIAEVPHPFVSETMDLFDTEDSKVKSKIHFIHFNHTNPLLFDPEKRQEVLDEGYNLAVQGKKY